MSRYSGSNVDRPTETETAMGKKEIMKAWKHECKGLYYLRTETSHRAENVAEKVKLNKLKDYSEDTQSQEDCEACQG